MVAGLGLLALGAGGRFLLQLLPNFETLMVAAFLAMLLLPLGRALLIIVANLYLSDVALGHVGWLVPLAGILLFTYSGYALVGLAAWLLRRRAARGMARFDSPAVLRAAGFGLLFTLVYDGWTNFGVFWLWYGHTPSNLLLVYGLGVPFALLHLYSSLLTFTLIGLPIWLACRHYYGRPATQPLRRGAPRSGPLAALRATRKSNPDPQEGG